MGVLYVCPYVSVKYYFNGSRALVYHFHSHRSFVAGGHKFVFMVKGPLMFVAVSHGPEYQQQIIQQITYAYNQILSVLTFTQLQTVFQRKPNFDLRFLLQGMYL